MAKIAVTKQQLMREKSAPARRATLKHSKAGTSRLKQAMRSRRK